MNLVQRLGITTLSIATLVALSAAPLIASADNDRVREVRDLRPLTQRVEVAISHSGQALVRGAQVSAISGSTITAVTTAGASTLTWTVATDGSTTFLAASGGGSSLSQIAVGHTISFAGALSGTGLNVKATAVKNWTVGANERSVSGAVQSINSAGTSFVIGNGNDNKKLATVQLSGSTVITLNGATTSFTSIATGNKVKATGTANADGTVLTATSVIIMRPAISLRDSDLGKNIRQWFSNHGLGIFDKSGKDKKDD
ncbi:hypothetical protein A2851_05585 [Candidatus Kaiserbacteria bacterium RIFCSPHIGHO2_01_FULL_53_29]|uniref:DUF5666 domain-containing protein n=1 Tax=Candidatus Kaiserbacteria bacterium RIFCSPHIGHO2_01_FULL_53_29 TaxID=1798480 RepID=A0A1F6CTH3_9BACT|nr:MAG: hypothetical protein A2851_05585 [Candidatus Kaiserbacteria bacterium RIFCSPHIGHO2_01_FULL_53_29]